MVGSREAGDADLAFAAELGRLAAAQADGPQQIYLFFGGCGRGGDIGDEFGRHLERCYRELEATMDTALGQALC